LRLALIGFGNVGQAFARLLQQQRKTFPFRIIAVHTRSRGTAYEDGGFGPAAESIDEFLDKARPEIVCDLTPLNPESGQPAISYIRKAFERGIHVVTANKGPIAFAYHDLHQSALQAGVQFRFESTCMDGAPVFNKVRNNLPGVRVLGFTGVLNSTTKIVLEALRNGATSEEGVRKAQALGIAETDPSYDLDGWDSAAKTAALANVLMDARTTPLKVERAGISGITSPQMRELASQRKTVALVSRGERSGDTIRLSVQPEVLQETDLLAMVQGTSNLLLLHTDLMGTVGTISLYPGVEQTAYGIFSDTVDIARSL
jgi:homoserine dehydrogenase